MGDLTERALATLDRRWTAIVLLVWAVFCGSLLLTYSPDIRLFNLPDTDDNMRLMQVRGLLSGQAWYDLRQHRLNPPIGANIHWSRVVDLSIAGLILVLRGLFDNSHAERLAVAIAPLLPLLLLFLSTALTARRLVNPRAYLIVFIPLYFSVATTEQFVPGRIDHHGWQLALLALSISAVADPRSLRGGLTLGISTGLSLAIGLDIFPYLTVLGVATALFWVTDVAEARRVRAYALSLGGTTIAVSIAFISYDNRSAVCDALSPVWLSDVMAAGTLLYALARFSPSRRSARLFLACAAAAGLMLFHAALWPQCLHQFDAVSPEAQVLWMRHVREEWPLYERDWRTVVLVIVIPATGLVGWGMLAWLRRDEGDHFGRVIAAASPTFVATLLLLWETRTAPAAQMSAAVGCAALIWLLVKLAWQAKSDGVALAGSLAATIIGSGAAAQLTLSLVPADLPSDDEVANASADAQCWSAFAMQSLDMQPKGLVMTFLDLGPRLITITHHSAIAGPYHRNSRQIVDVMNFWRGSADQAHGLATRYRANYVLSCPNSSVTAIFMSESPNGFYAQLQDGRVPKWLQPVQLPQGSPFMMWRVIS